MRTYIITCHHVYNFGASLQAYALECFLQSKGCEVEFIDYRPDYLSKNYNLAAVPNKKYDVMILKQLYLAAKFPKRFLSLFSKRKKRFDQFEYDWLRLTCQTYRSYEDLKKENWPDGLYLAGSDQIWNPIFPNGKDPAFFLRFIPDRDDIIKASYAASFGTSGETAFRLNNLMSDWINEFDAVSVREANANDFLLTNSINSTHVVDPVMLLDPQDWMGLAKHPEMNVPYILYYDFDSQNRAELIRKCNVENLLVISLTKTNDYRDDLTAGPMEFLGYVLFADVIYTSSFHCLVFSLIFHKEFFVLSRMENLNNRMTDLLRDFGLEDRLIQDRKHAVNVKPIDWNKIDSLIKRNRMNSESYLDHLLKMAFDTKEPELVED